MGNMYVNWHFTTYPKAKQPEYGDLYDVITHCGVGRNTKGRDQRSKPQVFLCHSTRGDNIIQITRQRMFCFYIPLFYEWLQS